MYYYIIILLLLYIILAFMVDAQIRARTVRMNRGETRRPVGLLNGWIPKTLTKAG